MHFHRELKQKLHAFKKKKLGMTHCIDFIAHSGSHVSLENPALERYDTGSSFSQKQLSKEVIALD
jgi:hypothetical protein